MVHLMETEKDDRWDVEQTEAPEAEEQDVITYQISYYPADFTLKGYLDKFESEQLQIPPFQRSYVWDQVKASKLIESFLLGLPVPGVFLYKERKTNRLQVIDGQQRILSAVRFFKNEFDERIFRLKSVHPKWDGKTYSELEEPDRFQLDDTVLRATVVQQLDPEDDSSIYHIFERLNTGGINLNPMEIRKCVYFGRYFSHLESLNEFKAWRIILGQPNLDKRLRDVELVLRVVALMYNADEYEKPMKGFLNKYMSAQRHLSSEAFEETIERQREEFGAVTNRIVNALGEKPFHLRGRLNYAVLDSVISTVHAKPGIEEDKLRAAFSILVKDEAYIDSATRNTSDDKTLEARFQKARDIFGSV